MGKRLAHAGLCNMSAGLVAVGIAWVVMPAALSVVGWISFIVPA